MNPNDSLRPEEGEGASSKIIPIPPAIEKSLSHGLIQALLGIAAFAAIAFHLGTSSLLETSEGRYGSVARAMLDSGDWLTPRLNGLAHYTKPPAAYWASAIGMAVFGRSEFGARAFLPFCAALTIIGCYQIGLRLLGARAALCSAFALLTSLIFHIQFRGLTTDPLLAAVETWMVLAFLEFMWKPRRRIGVMFWALAGLAMFVKGPPGLLPLLGLVPAFVLGGEGRKVVKLLGNFIGVVFFVVIGLGWYLAAIFANKELLSYFLVDQTLRRVATGIHDRGGPWHYFFWIILGGTFPWTPFLIGGFWRALGNLKKKPPLPYLPLLFWAGVPFVVLSLSASKLPAYALPLFVPCALLIGDYLSRMLKTTQDEPFIFKVESTASLVVLSLVGVALMYASLSGVVPDPKISKVFGFLSFSFIFLSFFGYYFMVLGIANGIMMVLGVVIPGAMIALLPGVQGAEEYSPGRFLPGYRELMKKVGSLPGDTRIYFIDDMIEGSYFYSGRVIPTWEVKRETRFDESLAESLNLVGTDSIRTIGTPGAFFLIRAKDLERVQKLIGQDLQEKERQGIWRLCLVGTAPERAQLSLAPLSGRREEVAPGLVPAGNSDATRSSTITPLAVHNASPTATSSAHSLASPSRIEKPETPGTKEKSGKPEKPSPKPGKDSQAASGVANPSH